MVDVPDRVCLIKGKFLQTQKCDECVPECPLFEIPPLDLEDKESLEEEKSKNMWSFVMFIR